MFLKKSGQLLMLLLVVQAIHWVPIGAHAESPTVRDEPSVSELTTACVEFEEQFFGVSFDQIITFKSTQLKPQRSTWSVSDDGMVAMKQTEFESQASDAKGKSYGRVDLRSADSNFSFGLTYPKFGPKKGLASQMTVDFLVDGFIRNAQQAFSLAPDSMDIEKYIGQCETTVKSEQRSSGTVYTLVCNHPKLPNKRFAFDTDLRLVFVEFDSESSNLFRNGFKNRPAMSLEGKMRGAKASGMIGPIKYTEFEDRWVVSEFNEKSVVGKEVSARKVEFTNHEFLRDDLSDLIEFEGIALPTGDTDRRVSSQGEPTIRYEIKDGKIVKVLDSDALAAASAARQRNGAYGSTKWYAALGLILVLAICVFVWSKSKSD